MTEQPAVDEEEAEEDEAAADAAGDQASDEPNKQTEMNPQAKKEVAVTEPEEEEQKVKAEEDDARLDQSGEHDKGKPASN